MQFWKCQPNGTTSRLSHLSTLDVLLQADAVTITIDIQKNGQRDTTLHHDALPANPLCPIQAYACHFVQARTSDPMNPNALISLYGPHQHVLAKHIAAVIQQGAVRSMIWLNGYDISQVGPHSLRASGAMQLALNGIPDSMIQKLGRWSSQQTWLQYLHGQISCLTRGLSGRMTTPVLYYNIGTRAED
jgi:integrase